MKLGSCPQLQVELQWDVRSSDSKPNSLITFSWGMYAQKHSKSQRISVYQLETDYLYFTEAARRRAVLAKRVVTGIPETSLTATCLQPECKNPAEA